MKMGTINQVPLKTEEQRYEVSVVCNNEATGEMGSFANATYGSETRHISSGIKMKRDFFVILDHFFAFGWPSDSGN